MRSTARRFFLYRFVACIPYTLNQELGVIMGCTDHLKGCRAKSQARLDGLRVRLGGAGFKQLGALLKVPCTRNNGHPGIAATKKGDGLQSDVGIVDGDQDQSGAFRVARGKESGVGDIPIQDAMTIEPSLGDPCQVGVEATNGTSLATSNVATVCPTRP